MISSAIPRFVNALTHAWNGSCIFFSYLGWLPPGLVEILRCTLLDAKTIST